MAGIWNNYSHPRNQCRLIQYCSRTFLPSASRRKIFTHQILWNIKIWNCETTSLHKLKIGKQQMNQVLLLVAEVNSTCLKEIKKNISPAKTASFVVIPTKTKPNSLWKHPSHFLGSPATCTSIHLSHVERGEGQLKWPLNVFGPGDLWPWPSNLT